MLCPSLSTLVQRRLTDDFAGVRAIIVVFFLALVRTWRRKSPTAAEGRPTLRGVIRRGVGGRRRAGEARRGGGGEDRDRGGGGVVAGGAAVVVSEERIWRARSAGDRRGGARVVRSSRESIRVEDCTRGDAGQLESSARQT